MALMLTKAGKALLQKIQVKEIETIDFTGIAVGSGLWDEHEINDSISALKEIRIKNGLSNKQTEVRDHETIVTIAATLNNRDIEEAFYVYEVGLYAMEGENEVLYAFDITPQNEVAQAVVQANTVPQYIPVVLDTALSSIDEANITITADIGFVSADQFEHYKQSIMDMLDGKQPVGDYVTSTLLQSELKNKSDIAHNHDNTYLKQTDAATNYATKTDLTTGLNGKAAGNHNHDGVYSNINHTHSGYAASNHTHSSYAASSHNHNTVYLKQTDAAKNYATKTEMTTGLNGKAASNHNHDSAYSKTNHTHSYMSNMPASIDLKPATTANHGGFIDFHHAGSSSDYTSRIIESASGKISIEASQGLFINGRLANAAPTATVAGSGIHWIEIPLAGGRSLLIGRCYKEESDYLVNNAKCGMYKFPLIKTVDKSTIKISGVTVSNGNNAEYSIIDSLQCTYLSSVRAFSVKNTSNDSLYNGKCILFFEALTA